MPAVTVIPINLTSRISTKHANEGDGIYAQTAVPIVVNDEIVIPAGSFVRGKVAHVKQPGRIKGRAEMSFSFQQITLPAGATFDILPASAEPPAVRRSERQPAAQDRRWQLSFVAERR